MSTQSSNIISTHRAAARVLVVGVGNIGSQVVSHLARDVNVAGITVCDKDCYSADNLITQQIDRREIGRSKALVQAERARAIAGSRIGVQAIAADVNDVPLGLLRADVCLGCLDSLAARRDLNRICWRLNMPWIDAGVHADGLLARVSFFRPSNESTCFECTIDPRNAAIMNHTFSCTGEHAQSAPTGAPSALGALAASVQAIECRKFLSGDPDQLPVGHEIVIDAGRHNQYVTRLPRNPRCTFDHDTWTIQQLPGVHTLSELRSHCQTLMSGERSLSIAVEERSWIEQLTCPRCRIARPMLLLNRSGQERERSCGSCGLLMLPDALHLRSRINLDELTPAQLRRSLRSIGLRRGDVLTITASGDSSRRMHVELGAIAPGDNRQTKRGMNQLQEQCT